MYYHVYGRNKYSKGLILHSRNHRSYEDAKKEKDKVKHNKDYSWSIKTSMSEIP